MSNSDSLYSATKVYNGFLSYYNPIEIPFDDTDYPEDPNMPPLENIYDDTDDEALDGKLFGAKVDYTNLELNIPVSPTTTTRVHKDHPKEQILSDPKSSIQTRQMTKELKDLQH